MEQGHAANAYRKATTAVEVIEAVIIPQLFDDYEDHHDALTATHNALFVDDDQNVWDALGAAHALYTARKQASTFTTSRPIIESELRRRMNATDTDQGDPFDVFASNQSGKN